MSDDVRRTAKPEAGSLTPEQMDLAIRHLPVDVSLADEDHTLIYWHGGTFEDCDATMIGRNVNDCHAPKSRVAIDKMIAAFTAGTRDEVVFWYVENEHQLVVRYVALRDADGAYRGMMESIVDLTALDGFRGKGDTLDS
ncbi:MAG: PAS domain-containing protein [Thermoleophilia bacterium]|nr:PAS domain-containing protein [Thermoleophilia bacterium]